VLFALPMLPYRRGDIERCGATPRKDAAGC
jgi:hypothetical protein